MEQSWREIFILLALCFGLNVINLNIKRLVFNEFEQGWIVIVYIIIVCLCLAGYCIN